MLSERIRNRAATLMSELRNQLLIESHNALDNEAGTTTLKGLLQVALDADFLRRIDAAIDEQVRRIVVPVAATLEHRVHIVSDYWNGLRWFMG